MGISLIAGGAVKAAWKRPPSAPEVVQRQMVAPETAGPVDINTAGEDALETLPGIGPTLASRIVAHRDTYGPFRSVGDLLQVQGIGEKRVAHLESLVTVGTSGALDTTTAAALDR